MFSSCCPTAAAHAVARHDLCYISRQLHAVHDPATAAAASLPFSLQLQCPTGTMGVTGALLGAAGTGTCVCLTAWGMAGTAGTAETGPHHHQRGMAGPRQQIATGTTVVVLVVLVVLLVLTGQGTGQQSGQGIGTGTGRPASVSGSTT